MADFTKWERSNLENVATDMLEALKDWKVQVNKEIEKRQQPHISMYVGSYNEHVICGLKLAMAMMHDAMTRQAKHK